MSVFDEDKRELVTCSVKNFNLHEDLAQLDYMFCDKTGTLTQNELIFKAFKIIGDSQESSQPQTHNQSNETKVNVTINESTLIQNNPRTPSKRFINDDVDLRPSNHYKVKDRHDENE